MLTVRVYLVVAFSFTFAMNTELGNSLSTDSLDSFNNVYVTYGIMAFPCLFAFVIRDLDSTWVSAAAMNLCPRVIK